jgi:cytosine/adenosine deaminase-related metal-dependent hydrolase
MSARARRAIVNGPIFTGTQVLHGHAVILEGAHVAEIVPQHAVPAKRPWFDAGGRLIVPGFVNAHHHAYSALATGCTCAPSANFLEVLEHLWWTLDAALTLEDVRLSARWTALQCLQHGATTVIDHHASYGAMRGSLQVVAGELERVGLSSVVCFEVSDRGGARAAASAIEENTTFLPTDRVNKLFGLHAAFTLSDATLTKVRAAAPPPIGFHIHCAEDALDVARNNHALIARLAAHDILRPATLLVHGVHLTNDELRRVAQAGCALAHCPDSNMHNGVGALDLINARARGVRVVAGTDGMHSNMLKTYKTAYELARHLHRDARVGFAETLAMYHATQALASAFFADCSGRLEPGTRADIAVLDYRPHTPIADDNVWGHLLYGAAEAPVHATIAGGELAYHAGVCATIDAPATSAAGQAAAAQLWQRMAVPKSQESCAQTTFSVD